VLTHLETALSPKVLTAARSLRLAHSQPATLHRQLFTLLFLEAVGLRRTWDLRGYSGQALALLTNRRLSYSYRHIVLKVNYLSHQMAITLAEKGFLGTFQKS